jgi:hypothetical protein
MKKVLITSCIFCFVNFFCFSSVYASAWDKCKGCHNGNVAKDEKKLKEKYPTQKKFIQAAKKSDDPFMIGVKSDEKLLKEAAQEIGLK